MRSVSAETPRKRIAIIGSVLVKHDAISDDIAAIWGFLSENPEWEVNVFAGCNELAHVPAQVVTDAGQLLFSRNFLDADLLIYEFGIYHPLFDAMLVGNGKAPQAVVFQNITPPHLVSEI